MTLPTSESNLYSQGIQIEMLCVQPIAYPIDNFVEIISSKINLSHLAKLSQFSSHYPNWLLFYDAKRRGAQSLYLFNCGSLVDPESLRNDIKKECSGEKAKLLSRKLSTTETRCNLLFDIRFNYFIIVYEICFSRLTREDFELLCNYQKNAEPKDDFYNELRSLLVREEEYCLLGSWGEACSNAARQASLQVLSECLNSSKLKKEIEIIPKTGNISFFVRGLSDFEDEAKLIEQLSSLNSYAEKSLKKGIALKIDEETKYLFGSRFHTIFLGRHRNSQRLKLIQFHMQYMWFYLSRLNDTVELINRFMVDSYSRKKVNLLDLDLAPLVMKIQLLNIHNERFKVMMESESENIYKQIQGSWNVEGSLSGASDFLGFLKQHLESIAENKRNILSKRLSSLLAVISFLQFMGLISVWLDYLTLVSDNKRKHPLFETSEILWNFNLFLPMSLFLFLILLWLVFTLFFRSRD